MPRHVEVKIVILTMLLLAAASSALGIELERDLRIWILGREKPQWVQVECAQTCMVDDNSNPVRNADISLRPGADSLSVSLDGKRHLEANSFVLLGTTRIITQRGTDRTYRGEIEVKQKDGALFIVNRIQMEEYLKSVTGCEMNFNELEAMKAQAVLARTLAAWSPPRYGDDADLDDLTTSQAYKGTECESELSIQAVELTSGEVLAFQGQPIQPFYHSTSGGMTTTARAVWGSEDKPYIQAVDDGDFSADSPHYRWSVVLGPRQLEALSVEARTPVERIQVLERDGAGRVSVLALGSGDELERMSGYNFYRLAGQSLGWNVVKSTWFEVQEAPGGIELRGKGLGHGVGMCQWGARGHARQGWDYIRILEHYFPGARLMQLYTGDNPNY